MDHSIALSLVLALVVSSHLDLTMSVPSDLAVHYNIIGL